MVEIVLHPLSLGSFSDRQFGGPAAPSDLSFLRTAGEKRLAEGDSPPRFIADIPTQYFVAIQDLAYF